MDNRPGNVVLASGSRYRKQLLERLLPDFRTLVTNVDEAPLTGETPVQLARRLSRAKALAAAAECEQEIVIGGDQVAAIGDQIIGKPGDHQTAKRQLSNCSGRAVEFHTGVCVLGADGGFDETHVDHTVVHFRQLDDDLIERYLRREQPYDCAGSFKAEQLGVVLFDRIETSDPSAITGLPLIWLAASLGRAGVDLI